MNSSARCILNHERPPRENVILDGPCTIFFALSGLIGNLYGLRQLSLLQLGKNFQIYLRTLAMWDMCVLVCALVQYGLLNMVFLLSAHAYHAAVWSYLANIFHGPLVTALTGSCWMTVAIAILRYIAVARPVVQTANNQNRSVLVCILISAVTVFYCFPINFEVQLMDCFCHATGRNEVQIWPRLFLVTNYRLFYRSYAYLVLVTLGPFVTILGLSVRTMMLVHRSIQRSGTKTARSSRRQKKLGVLFSILLLKFVVCNFAATAVFLLTSIFGQQLLHDLPGFTHSFCNFAALLHNATNFLLHLPWYKSGSQTPSNKSYCTARSKRPSCTIDSAPSRMASSAVHVRMDEIRPLYNKSCPNLSFIDSDDDLSERPPVSSVNDDVRL